MNSTIPAVLVAEDYQDSDDMVGQWRVYPEYITELEWQWIDWVPQPTKPEEFSWEAEAVPVVRQRETITQHVARSARS